MANLIQLTFLLFSFIQLVLINWWINWRKLKKSNLDASSQFIVKSDPLIARICVGSCQIIVTFDGPVSFVQQGAHLPQSKRSNFSYYCYYIWFYIKRGVVLLGRNWCKWETPEQVIWVCFCWCQTVWIAERMLEQRRWADRWELPDWWQGPELNPWIQ